MAMNENAEVPARAALLSLLCLTVPIAGTLLLPERATELEALLWLLALVPAFLLAYYRGWRGVAIALAVGMAVLAATQLGAALVGNRIGNWPLYLGVIAVYIVVSLGFGALSERLRRIRLHMEKLELADPLTALPNARAAEFYLQREFAAAQRGRPLTVVLFDLDRLREYADRKGRLAAEAALRTFARVLNEQTRRMNLAARLGDEEFLAALSGVEPDGALVFVHRVREALVEIGPSADHLAVCAGIAAFHRGMERPDDLIRAARTALLRARAAARPDRIGMHDAAPELAAEAQERVARVREHLKRAEVRTAAEPL